MSARPIKLSCPLYRFECVVVRTPAALNRYAKSLGYQKSDYSAYAGVTQVMGDTFYVGVFDGRLKTLVHELTHVALDVLGDRGIDPRQADGEPMAYLLEWLFSSVLKKGKFI